MNQAGQDSPGNGPTPAPKPVYRDNDMADPTTGESSGSLPGNQEQALMGTTPIGPNMQAGALSPYAGMTDNGLR